MQNRPGQPESSMSGNSHTESSTVGNVIREAGHKIDDLSQKAAEKSDKLIKGGSEMASYAQEEIGKYTDTVVEYVKDNPVKSILIAGAVGLLIAKLLKS